MPPGTVQTGLGIGLTSPVPAGQRQPGERPTVDYVMAHLLARLAAALGSGVAGISPMDSILVPHSTLWYPGGWGGRSAIAKRVPFRGQG